MRYAIKGDSMPVAEIQLESGEQIRCQKGAMAWMSANMEMDTKGDGIGHMIGRKMTGESAFQNVYTAKKGPGLITVGGNFPGSIVVATLDDSSSIIAQKTAYLASSIGIWHSPYLQKKIGTALFGGEGFVMERISGRGIVFLEIDGSAIKKELRQGEKLIVSTGHVAFMSGSCSMDIQTVGGVMNTALGGEGFFNTVVTGPGTVVLQTMPKQTLISAIVGDKK